MLSRFGSDGRSFAGNSLETWFDGGHWATRTANFALQEEEARIFLKNGIGRATRVTCYVLFHVPTQHILHLFLLETTFDDELVVTIYWAAGTQFSKQEGKQMFRLSMKPVTDQIYQHIILQISFVS